MAQTQQHNEHGRGYKKYKKRNNAETISHLSLEASPDKQAWRSYKTNFKQHDIGMQTETQTNKTTQNR